ncbi:5'-nucleotidase [Paenibacillus sp. FSL R7-0273]|uniref:HAD family hydrolase n=1 Tax=Paenibacillus sp. FSL R7-0273 TaxID=1536772 RepID=UPI0004F5F3CB|nr:HAD family hydrolase [Paenibacillus sp. FSL R7-0273]AIQ47099.1 5'-nucleotidase [Paenibacillus sp. FSL R7-0273]OMF97148.1 phosphoglycolate phosphatase [Paenibacillus sp. FSL R7-0273]
MNGELKHILFDLDGTLTDPKEGITRCVEYALNKFGITVEHLDLLLPYIGPPLYDSFVQIQGLPAEDAAQAVVHYRERYSTVGMFENAVIPGIPGLLEALRAKGYTLYVATSKPTVFAEQIIRHYGLERYFRHVAGSNLDGTRSKKAEVIRYVLEQGGITPGEAVMIGDREHDIIGAKACGVASIGVLIGYGSESELSASGADYIAATVEEIGQIVTRISVAAAG